MNMKVAPFAASTILLLARLGTGTAQPRGQ